jgi:hypothetical protein
MRPTNNMKVKVHYTELQPTKLGRKLKTTFGQCDTSTNEIWIHPAQPESEILDSLIHEAIHLAYPNMSEKRVIKGANIISDILWSQKYRRK